MRYCLRPGCSLKVLRGYCPRHDPAREAVRPNVEVRRWYRTERWQALCRIVKAAQPRCPGSGAPGEARCEAPTEDVDHQVPHGGDMVRFWDPRNLVARCNRCHSRKTRREQQEQLV